MCCAHSGPTFLMSVPNQVQVSAGFLANLTHSICRRRPLAGWSGEVRLQPPCTAQSNHGHVMTRVGGASRAMLVATAIFFGFGLASCGSYLPSQGPTLQAVVDSSTKPVPPLPWLKSAIRFSTPCPIGDRRASMAPSGITARRSSRRSASVTASRSPSGKPPAAVCSQPR